MTFNINLFFIFPLDKSQNYVLEPERVNIPSSLLSPDTEIVSMDCGRAHSVIATNDFGI